MSFCKICGKETETFYVKAILSDINPPRRVGIDLRYKTNLQVCSSCGFIRLPEEGLPYLKMLDTGYPVVTEDDLKKIDVDLILNEMEIPLIHSREVKIWVERSIFKVDQLDDLSNGITFDHAHYYRLVHYFLLKPEARKKITGNCRCPVLKFQLDDVGGHPLPVFKDGRRRFSLLTHLGAKRIPVSVIDTDLEKAVELGFRFYSEKGEINAKQEKK
jgi:hypothetical protein